MRYFNGIFKIVLEEHACFEYHRDSTPGVLKLYFELYYDLLFRKSKKAVGRARIEIFKSVKSAHMNPVFFSAKA